MDMHGRRFSKPVLAAAAAISVSILALASPAAAIECGVAFTYPVVGGTVTVESAGASTGTSQSIACGNNATATGTPASDIALGNQANGNGSDSANIAIGGQDAFAGFAGTNASGNMAFNIAIGNSANASGTGSGGGPDHAAFTNNIAVGSNANASGNGASNIAIGLNTTASGNAFAFGPNANAAGVRSIAFGSAASTFNSTTSTGAHDAVAIGSTAVASGSTSTAMGKRAAATGTQSAAVGTDASASGIAAIAVGAKTSATAHNAVALGKGANVTGANSIAIGLTSSASATNAIAIGARSVADVASVVSVGAAGHERRIVNVRNAVNPTDAVNLQQVQALVAAASPRVAYLPAAKSTAVKGGGVSAANKNGNTLVRSGDGTAETTRHNERVASLSPSSQAKTDAAVQPVASLACELGGAGVTTAVSEQSSGSSAFELVQQSGISFREGGSATGCVTLSISAEVLALGGSAMEMRAVLDGGVEASPGPVLFTQENDTFHSRAFTFVFTNVAPGAHRVDIQFRNAGEGGFVRIGHRTAVVQFAK